MGSPWGSTHSSLVDEAGTCFVCRWCRQIEALAEDPDVAPVDIVGGRIVMMFNLEFRRDAANVSGADAAVPVQIWRRIADAGAV
jgi:hypothetical protein